MAHHRGLPRQIDSDVKPTAMRTDRLQNEREFREWAGYCWPRVWRRSTSVVGRYETQRKRANERAGQ